MSSTLPPNQPDDEIVSAVLDGVAPADQRTLVAADPAAQQRLQDFEQVRAALAASPAPEQWAQAALAAALDAFTEIPASARAEAFAIASGSLAASAPLATAVTPIGSSARAPRALRILGELAAAAAVVVGIAVVGHRSSTPKAADAPARASLETNAAGAPSAASAAAATTAGASQVAIADTGAAAATAPSDAAKASDGGAAPAAAASRPGPTAAANATSVVPVAPAAASTTAATAAPTAPPTSAAPDVVDDAAALRAWVAAHPASAGDQPLPCATTLAGARSVGRVRYQGTLVQVLTLDPRIVALDDTTCQSVVDLPS